MGRIKKFFEKRKTSRLERTIVKRHKIEEKAKEFEFNAELASGIAGQKEKIRKAKRKMFESSPAFRAIGKIQKGAVAVAKHIPKQSGSSSSGLILGGDLGMGGSIDLFGSEPAPRKTSRSKKRKKKYKKNRYYRPEPIEWF